MNPLVVQLIVLLAPRGLVLVQALIDLLIRLINAGEQPTTLAEISMLIHDQIREAHPDWNEVQVAKWTVDAVAVWAAKRNPVRLLLNADGTTA